MDIQAALQNSQSRYFEFRSLPSYYKCLEDIAKHLLMRQELGKTLILMCEIDSYYAPLRKQWLKQMEHLKRVRSSIADVNSIREIDRQLERMQSMSFARISDKHASDADVHVFSPDNFKVAPDCRTVYLCPDVPSDAIANLTDALPKGSVVVNYEIS